MAPKRRASGPKRTGRPDALTKEAGDAIVGAIRAGAAIKEAAEHAGIGSTTVYRWLERAEEKKAPPKFREFRDALTRARADAKVSAIAAIRRAMPEDWRAALAYLERRYPEEWARRSHTELTGAGGGPVEVKTDVADVREAHEHLRRLAQASEE